MKLKIIRIIAAVVDTHNLCMYKEDGEMLTIPQGDIRVRSIIEAATPQLLQQGYADVDIAEQADSEYLDFEEKSNGVVKLYQIAKDKLKSLFALGIAVEVPQGDAVSPVVLGEVPTGIKQTQAVVEEIMQHAVPVSSPEFHEKNVAKQGNVVEESGNTIKSHSVDSASETVVAVVDGKIIPGMEKIKSQFTCANKLGSATGIENFLRRIATVIEDRSHSVEDLLKFLERGDMPIADDGSILIYKVLKTKGDKTDGKYVDCHTGKVEQWTGAYVCMDASLVDRNRHNECSNGLHVARRGYIKEFSGDVCVLAKLAPEDVIAVPAYDANKMRVCGYHIIMELSKAQHGLLMQNRPITDNAEGKTLLANAMSGKHVSKTHEVRITEHKGGGVVVKVLTEIKLPSIKKTSLPAKVEAIGNTTDKKDDPVNPKDVVAKVEQLSRKEIAAKLYAEGKVEELKAYKKNAKVSWDKLGVPDPDVIPPVVVPKDIIGNNPSTIIIDEIGEGSYKERIQKLLSIGLTSVGVAQAIRELKKKSKKRWDVLGVSAEQAEQIITLAQ